MTSEQQRDGANDTGIWIIPPFVLLGALVVAFLIDWAWPTRVGLPDSLRLILGAILILAPFVIMPSVIMSFRRVGVHYDVRKAPTALVTDGAFRYTRNPGYVLGITFGAGVGFVANNPWVFLCLVPALAIIHYGVILKEEAVLENRFGEVYLDYRRRVRRWI